MKTILYETDKAFAARVFPNTPDGFKQKIYFFLILLPYSYLFSQSIQRGVSSLKDFNLDSEFNHNLTGFIQSFGFNISVISFLYFIIAIVSLYPIFVANKEVFIRFVNCLFFSKRIRLLNYIAYIHTLEIEQIAKAMAQDQNMKESTKQILTQHIMSYALMEIQKSYIQEQKNQITDK